MSLFEKELTVNEGINRARTEEGAVLLDVRRKSDYKLGYVKGAVNIPLDRMDLLAGRFPDKEAHFYVIGSYADRPQKAKKAMKKLGYKNVTCSGVMEEHHGLLSKSKK